MTTNILPFPTDTARAAPLRLSVVSDNPASVIILPKQATYNDNMRKRREVSADICGND